MASPGPGFVRHAAYGTTTKRETGGTAEVASRHANLVPVATLDTAQVYECRRRDQTLGGWGQPDLSFLSRYQGWPLDSPSLRRILAMLDEAQAVIVVGGPVSPVLPDTGLRTPVILAGAHVYQLADTLALAGEVPNVYLGTRLLIGPGSVEVAVSHLGAERLVFGSHAPVVYQASALRVVQAADLKPRSGEAILKATRSG